MDAFLRERGFTELSDSALRRRNGKDAVEAALRYAAVPTTHTISVLNRVLFRMASVCGAERDFAKIESLLKFAATTGDGRPAPHIIKARAYSLWASVRLRVYESYDPNTESARERLEMRSWLFSAGKCANHASDLHLVSLAVIEVAQTISQSSACEEAFNKFSHLKTAYDEYKACKERKDQPPTQSIPCAAECGIYASKLSGLLRCTGQCPLELKPLYCTKECQKLVSAHFIFTTVLLLLTACCRTGNGTSLSVVWTLHPTMLRPFHRQITRQRGTLNFAVQHMPSSGLNHRKQHQLVMCGLWHPSMISRR